MKYRHLNGQTHYYPFAARTALRRRRNRWSAFFAFLAVLLAILAAVLLVRRIVFRGGQPDAPLPEAQVPNGTVTVSMEQPAGGEVLDRYRRLYAQNPDLIGWLEIPGTGIDYPVVQTPGDNERYLRLGFDGLYAEGGTLFLDERCSVTLPTANCMIYGHNMADGSMFAPLLQYADADFAAAHPTIRFDSIYQEGSWQVLAAFYATVGPESNFAYYTFFDAASEEEWQAFYDGCKQAALYDTGVTASYGDPLLTLSTCAQSRTTDERFAVVARRISD